MPLRWWVQATMLLASLWLAFIVSMPAVAAWTATAVLVLITFAGFVVVRHRAGRGARRRAVRRARPTSRSTCSVPSSRWTPRRPAGCTGSTPTPAPSCYTRPYLKRSVLVPVLDPADRTPYWLVSTRHPHRLAAALDRREPRPLLTRLNGYSPGGPRKGEGHGEGQERRRRRTARSWTIFSLVAALTAAAVAKKGLNTAWKAATGKNPPANPADPDVDVWEAVLWATVSGTAIGLARMLATRRAAKYYAKSTGHLPPGLRQGRPGRRRAHAGHLTPSTLRQSTTKGRSPVGDGPSCVSCSARVRRSRCRSASSRPRAGCGGAPGSSSCR